MKTLTTLSDQQIVEMYITGDPDALTSLITRHQDKIYTSIYLLVKDRYLAEDIFQEVFIRIIDSLNSGHYTDSGRFLPWAMRIAHNLCVDHFRKTKRTPVIKTADGSDIFELTNFSQPETDLRIVVQETAEKVRSMLDLLPQDQREVIIFRHYADLSFKEIAKITNCSVNTALGRMRYGLSNLRKIIDEKNIAL